MRIFFDTCILVDFLCNRNNAKQISDLDNVGLRTGVNNLSFLDLEDSYQFQSAVNVSCEVLLTDNLSDYKQVDHSVMRILSPDRFIELFGS